MIGINDCPEIAIGCDAGRAQPHAGADGSCYDRLGRAWSKLGPRARLVLVQIAERLEAGAEQYRDDFEKRRDWRREALEEALDQAVYAARGLQD